MSTSRPFISVRMRLAYSTTVKHAGIDSITANSQTERGSCIDHMLVSTAKSRFTVVVPIGVGMRERK